MSDLFLGPDDGSAGLNGEDEYQHAHREENERGEKMEEKREKGKEKREKGKEKEEKKESKQAEAPKTWAQKIAAQKSDEKEVKTPAPAAPVKAVQPAKVSVVERVSKMPSQAVVSHCWLSFLHMSGRSLLCVGLLCHLIPCFS